MRLLFVLLLLSFDVHAKKFDLVDIAFDKNIDDSQRWRSLVALSVQDGQGSIEHLTSALKSDEWFMRDAALVAIGGIDKELSLKWARKLLTEDPSMIVRTTAVKIIKENGSKKDVPILLNSIFNKKNYRQGRSLWIRHQIAEAISHLDKSSYHDMLRLLDDSDDRVNVVALKALEEITGHKPDYKNKDLQTKIAIWKDILNKKKNL